MTVLRSMALITVALLTSSVTAGAQVRPDFPGAKQDDAAIAPRPDFPGAKQEDPAVRPDFPGAKQSEPASRPDFPGAKKDSTK
jgi:hypothetical protein